MIKKILCFTLTIVLIAGCAGPQGLEYEVSEWKTYENDGLGISFQYPDYYGDPVLSFPEGKEGESFYLRFQVEYLPDDPYLIYVTGLTADFDNQSEFVRRSYRGEYPLSDFCVEGKEYIPFVDISGSCEIVNDGSMQNLAILDAGGSSVEQVYMRNYPGGKYSGLQIGFRVPFDYVEYGLLAKGDLRGPNAVEDLVERLDSEDVPGKLIDELDRFRVLLDSVKFI